MIVAIPEDLRQVLGPEGARALAELLNRVGHEMRDDVIAISEERFQRHLADEFAELRALMARFESGLREDMAGLDSKLRGDMARLESGLEMRLSDRMNRLETRLLRWSFGFRVTQLLALGALIFTLFRFAHP